MNRNTISLALSLALLTGGTAFAQTPAQETTKTTKVATSPVSSQKTTEHTVVGTVKSYKAGEKLKVLVGKKTRSFDLDDKHTTFTVDPTVAIGSKVKVLETKDPNGKKTITISISS